jgi:hypothetical protein
MRQRVELGKAAANAKGELQGLTGGGYSTEKHMIEV